MKQTSKVGVNNNAEDRINPATEDTLSLVLTALQLIDNFISGTRGLVTEDNSGAIKTALEIIDNMISGNSAIVQDKYVLPLATNVSSTLTLTSANTAYQITEPASDFLVTFCNMSDTDMYWGFATLTSGGILLPKNGGTLTLKCTANASPFFYCASAGKVLNYTTTLI